MKFCRHTAIVVGEVATHDDSRFMRRMVKTSPNWLVLASLLLSLCFLPGCGSDSDADAGADGESTSNDASDDSTESGVLRLASTTSTRDSGLFDILLPVFEEANACRVDLVAVGTGAALKLGESGDVDVLVVHARSAEEAFMKAGHGARHEPLMHNFFLIVGPNDDPADVIGTEPEVALKRIAEKKARFLSRGDDSGTHMREQALWKAAGGRPKWGGFTESGQGMGATLTMADEMNSYVIVDGGTWRKRKNKLELIPIVTEGENLKNPYAAIVVTSTKEAPTNSKLANRFADFLISEEAQKLIGDYQLQGQPLFHPDRLAQESTE